MWVESAAENDVLLFQPSVAAPSTVFVSFDSSARRWNIAGIGSAETYSSILQVISPARKHLKRPCSQVPGLAAPSPTDSCQ